MATKDYGSTQSSSSFNILQPSIPQSSRMSTVYFYSCANKTNRETRKRCLLLPKLTFADWLCARPLFVSPTSPGLITNKHVTVFALVTNNRVVSAGCVDRFPMSGVFWWWTLNSCNHNTRKPPTQLSSYLQRNGDIILEAY